MGDLSECFFSFPPIKLLAALIPVCDDIVEVTHEHRVARKVEEPGLFAVRLCKSPQPPDQAGDDKRRGEKGDEGSEILSLRNIEDVNRFYEEIDQTACCDDREDGRGYKTIQQRE